MTHPLYKENYDVTNVDECKMELCVTLKVPPESDVFKT